MDERFAIREATEVGPHIVKLVVHAPRVAKHALPGQFVMVRPDANSERIPLTICNADRASGCVTLVVQTVGATTADINSKSRGDHLTDVLGPLGMSTEIDRFGICVVVAGGVGAAIVLPVAQALASAGNTVVGIIGARDDAHLILVDELREACDEVHVVTEEGSRHPTGLVTDALGPVLESGTVDRVLTAGPIPMMRAVAACTRLESIPTVASLNPIMVDGTGMCGGCRVSVGGDTRFACIDGPEFDAHLVDFASLEKRNEAYHEFEACRLKRIRAV